MRVLFSFALLTAASAACTVHHHYDGPVTVNGPPPQDPSASAANAGPSPSCPPVPTCGEAGSSAPVPLVPHLRDEDGYPCEVAIDPAHAAIVTSHVDGRVASLRVNLAERVRANEVVGTVEPSRGGRAVELHAPIDGEVVERPGTVGRQVGPQQDAPLLYIADLDRVWVIAAIPQAELPRMHVGQPAMIRIAMYPDRMFAGRVSRVLATIDPERGVGHVVIELSNLDRSLRPGARGVARIQTESTASPSSSSSSSSPPPT